VRAGRVSVVGVLSVCRKLWSWRWFSEEAVSKQVGSTTASAGAIAAFGCHFHSTTHCRIYRSAETESCLPLLQNIIFFLYIADHDGSVVVQIALQVPILKTSTLQDYFPPFQANITVQSRKRNYGLSNSHRYVPDSRSQSFRQPSRTISDLHAQPC
jgi:hypothetical protein